MPTVNVPGVTVGISAAVQMSASADGATDAGASWYYVSYDVNDWAWNDCGTPCANGNGTAAVPPSPTTTLNNITLNPPGQSNTSAQYFAVTRYTYRPYDGNTFALRVRVFF